MAHKTVAELLAMAGPLPGPTFRPQPPVPLPDMPFEELGSPQAPGYSAPIPERAARLPEPGLSFAQRLALGLRNLPPAPLYGRGRAKNPALAQFVQGLLSGFSASTLADMERQFEREAAVRKAETEQAQEATRAARVLHGRMLESRQSRLLAEQKAAATAQEKAATSAQRERERAATKAEQRAAPQGPKPVPAQRPSTPKAPKFVLQTPGEKLRIRTGERALKAAEAQAMKTETALGHQVYAFTRDPLVIDDPKRKWTASQKAAIDIHKRAQSLVREKQQRLLADHVFSLEQGLKRARTVEELQEAIAAAPDDLPENHPVVKLAEQRMKELGGK